MDVKPIFTIGVPIASCTQASLNKLRDEMKRAIPDYHLIFYGQSGSENVIFEAFYEKDLKVDEFEAFQQRILNNMKNDQ